MCIWLLKSFLPVSLLPFFYPYLHKELRQEKDAGDLFSPQELNVSEQLGKLKKKLAFVLFFSANVDEELSELNTLHNYKIDFKKGFLL